MAPAEHVRLEHANWRGIGEGTEPFFAFPQGVLCLLSAEKVSQARAENIQVMQPLRLWIANFGGIELEDSKQSVTVPDGETKRRLKPELSSQAGARKILMLRHIRNPDRSIPLPNIARK